MALSIRTGVPGGEAPERSIFLGADAGTGSGNSLVGRSFITTSEAFQSITAGIDHTALKSLLTEAHNDKKASQAILARFGNTETGVFQQLSGESQRLLVQLAIEQREASTVVRLGQHSSYNCQEQLHGVLLERITEQSFSSATWLIKNVGAQHSDKTVSELARQANELLSNGSLLAKEHWLQLFHTVDSGLIRQLDQFQLGVTLGLSLDLDALELARHVADAAAVPDAELRSLFVPRLLMHGRVETAANLASACGQRLNTEEVQGVIEQLGPSEDRVAQNLTLFAANALSPDLLPEVLLPAGDFEFAAFVLLEYRDRIFGSMSEEGGHVSARLRFQESIFAAGLSGRPEVLGGTCVAFHRESGDLVVQGRSGTYGLCDKERACSMLERAYAPLNVRIGNNF